jgi:hypothetical protein
VGLKKGPADVNQPGLFHQEKTPFLNISSFATDAPDYQRDRLWRSWVAYGDVVNMPVINEPGRLVTSATRFSPLTAIRFLTK